MKKGGVVGEVLLRQAAVAGFLDLDFVCCLVQVLSFAVGIPWGRVAVVGRSDECIITALHCTAVVPGTVLLDSIGGVLYIAELG